MGEEPESAITKTARMRYVRGVRTERRLIEELQGEGFATIRASQSRGNFDVIGIREDKIVLCSVKRAATWKGAASAYKKERARLEAVPVPKTPKIERRLYVWSDTLGPAKTGNGGMWYCAEVV